MDEACTEAVLGAAVSNPESAAEVIASSSPAGPLLPLTVSESMSSPAQCEAQFRTGNVGEFCTPSFDAAAKKLRQALRKCEGLV
jgi:hypothetical protein